MRNTVYLLIFLGSATLVLLLTMCIFKSKIRENFKMDNQAVSSLTDIMNDDRVIAKNLEISNSSQLNGETTFHNNVSVNANMKEVNKMNVKNNLKMVTFSLLSGGQRAKLTAPKINSKNLKIGNKIRINGWDIMDFMPACVAMRGEDEAHLTLRGNVDVKGVGDETTNFGGSSVVFVTGNYRKLSGSDGGINKNISSIKVNPGFTVEIFKNANFDDSMGKIVGPYILKLETGDRDEIESMKVYKTQN